MESITLRSAKAQPVEAAQEEKILVVMLWNFRIPPWLNWGVFFFSGRSRPLPAKFDDPGIERR